MEEQNNKNVKNIRCSRCNINLEYKGTKSFHEGTRWWALGELGELFVNKEQYDVYYCPTCGVVEFFVDQVGEEQRPHWLYFKNKLYFTQLSIRVVSHLGSKLTTKILAIVKIISEPSKWFISQRFYAKRIIIFLWKWTATEISVVFF